MDRADRVMDRVKVDGPLEHFRVDVNVTKNDNLVNTVHFHPFPSSTSDLKISFSTSKLPKSNHIPLIKRKY